MRRLGKPSDLQGPLIYLCSDLAGFVDSEVFVVYLCTMADGRQGVYFNRGVSGSQCVVTATFGMS